MNNVSFIGEVHGMEVISLLLCNFPKLVRSFCTLIEDGLLVNSNQNLVSSSC